MNTTLTLTIDKNVVENAEIYARTTKKSVSQLVEAYLSSIPTENMIAEDRPLGPITSRLAGIIRLDEEPNHKALLHDALMEKYL